jgi:type II secretion system protein I
MTSTTGKKCTRGFTLLEVLIAVAIFAVGVTAVLQGFQVSMHAMERAHQVMVCSRLAGQRLDALRIACRSGAAPRSDGGDFAEPHEEYHWQVIASEESPGSSIVAGGGGEGGLYRVELRVWQREESDGVIAESHLYVGKSGDENAL